jgi:multiple sugar transport system permease protein
MGYLRDKLPHMSLSQIEAVSFYLFISPYLLGLLILTLGAVLFSLGMSLTDWRLGREVSFIGIANFVRALQDDPVFWQSLRVTAFYSFVAVPLNLTVGLAVAILLNQKVRGLTLFRTIFYLPSLVGGVAMAMLWVWIFNPEFGLLNWLLSLIGLRGPEWIFSPEWALPAFILMNLWTIGSGMLINLAGLQAIPTHLYEAAEIDGAGSWGRFRHVTIPMMSPVIFFNLVLGIIASFQIFTQAYVMTNGGPANATLFYVLHLYRNAFEYLNMGYASALAWILFVIILFFTLLVFRSSTLWVFYQGELRGGRGRG